MKTFFLARTPKHFKIWIATCPYKFINPIYVNDPSLLEGLHNNFQVILLSRWYEQKTKAFNRTIKQHIKYLKLFYPYSIITERQFKNIDNRPYCHSN